jgi:glycosyltransferase involved in cell wall biosynthesis
MPADSKVIVLPASFRQVKDPFFAINAIKDLLLENPNHYFHFKGPILDAQYWEQVVQGNMKRILQANPELSQRLLISEFLPHNDFLKFLEECDLLVNSSESEGMSGVILEAMNMGVPCLVRANEGNCQLIRDGMTGITFNTVEEFAAGYRRIFNDELARENIIKNAKNEFENKYSFEVEVKHYGQLMEKIKALIKERNLG